NHSLTLTQILYVWDIQNSEWENYLKQNQAYETYFLTSSNDNPLSPKNLETFGEGYLQMLKNFAENFPYTRFKGKYINRLRKISAVMSCGKNFAIWKTAGREIPWDTPPSPNNIIHVRLATGSVVEQMNAHPFGKIHTALTHNGETTNYEALKQRVEQFGLPPLATTDTEVASLKFHLVAEELEYPDWALFESFSPTTGDDLALMPEEIRKHLEDVQRVEFASSPDGPYQYLCLRHNPAKNETERVDLKDPADLRPGTTVFWIDQASAEKRAYSIIASEEQAAQRVLELLDKEELIEGAAADKVMVSNGMISRYRFGQSGQITGFQFVDRYGREMELEDFGEHYSISRKPLKEPANVAEVRTKMNKAIKSGGENWRMSLQSWIREELSRWDFNTFRWVLQEIADFSPNGKNEGGFPAEEVIALLTYFIDYLRTMDSCNKAKSSLLDITRTILYRFLDRFEGGAPEKWFYLSIDNSEIAPAENPAVQTLVINATAFSAEGIDPDYSLSALLSKAYNYGWRKFILYRVNGQRLISTAVMGNTDTDDVEMDIYGIPGEYFAAFMQGGIIRLHGNAQNFTAMCMHHGELQVFGNAGKVCGYASKGGRVFILGDIVDRGWTNSVNDPRCQDLQIHILGSASKYCGESLMGGDFFFGGLYFDTTGKLRIQDRPYRGTKLLGGASRGNMLFFDPNDRLDPHQYAHGKPEPLTAENWPRLKQMVIETLKPSGIEVARTNNDLEFTADGRQYKIEPR
ncbi:MAG: hypothetical protein ACE5GL_07555, partial [Calditrichia bacterium]